MMSEEKAVKVGDKGFVAGLAKVHMGCRIRVVNPQGDFATEVEYKGHDTVSYNLYRLQSSRGSTVKVRGTWDFTVLNVPERKPEVPDEPRTRGDVVTIEGDDEFIAVRFTMADDMPYPFVGAFSYTGAADICSWGEIVSRAAGRKIIVHKTADPNEAPVKVDTYAEWTALPEDELKKYQWKDADGDIWFFSDLRGEFVVYVGDDNIFPLDDEYFPLIRDGKVG